MGSQINSFLMILLVSLAVGIPLALWTSLPYWVVIIISPAAAIGLLRLFSVLADHLERPKKSPSKKKSRVQTDDFPGPKDSKKEGTPIKPVSPIKQKCPKCGSANVAQIIYGLTTPSEELKKDIKEKRVTLGGCMVYDGAPEWRCNKCGNKYGAIKIQ
jgi:hypothetical protein